MPLHYEPDHDCYIGERLTVSGTLLRKAMHDLVASGMPQEDVLSTLLEEEGWSPEMHGVAVRDRRDWAPTLWFDLERRGFVGPHLCVDFLVFYPRLRGLTAGDTIGADAYNDMRQESNWSLEMPGVTPSLLEADVVAEVIRLLRQRAH